MHTKLFYITLYMLCLPSGCWGTWVTCGEPRFLLMKMMGVQAVMRMKFVSYKTKMYQLESWEIRSIIKNLLLVKICSCCWLFCSATAKSWGGGASTVKGLTHPKQQLNWRNPKLWNGIEGLIRRIVKRWRTGNYKAIVCINKKCSR